MSKHRHKGPCASCFIQSTKPMRDKITGHKIGHIGQVDTTSKHASRPSGTHLVLERFSESSSMPSFASTGGHNNRHESMHTSTRERTPCPQACESPMVLPDLVAAQQSMAVQRQEVLRFVGGTCPRCDSTLRELPDVPVLLWTLAGPTQAALQKLHCPSCHVEVWPQFVQTVIPSGPQGGRPSVRRLALLCATLHAPTQIADGIFISDEVLSWFDRLHVNGGLTATAMCASLPSPPAGVRIAHLEASALWHAHEMRILRQHLIALHGQGLLPNVRPTEKVHPLLDMGALDRRSCARVQNTYLSVISEILPLVRVAFVRQWIERHGDFCTAECCTTMLIDGNWKLGCTGCHAVVAQPVVAGTTMTTVQLCGRPCVGLGLTHCFEHGGHARRQLALQAAPRSRPVAEDLTGGHECADKRGTIRGAREGNMGLLGSCFLECGVWGPFQRLQFSESRAQVLRFLQDVRACNPQLRLVGYDDFCHIEESLQRHRPSGLDGLQGFIDRWHLRGHVRSRCHIELSADVHRCLWVWQSHTISTESELMKLQLATKRMHGCVHSVAGFDGVCAPPAAVLRVAREVRLPAQFNFLMFAEEPAIVHSIHITTQGGRTSLLGFIDRRSLRLKASCPCILTPHACANGIPSEVLSQTCTCNPRGNQMHISHADVSCQLAPSLLRSVEVFFKTWL